MTSVTEEGKASRAPERELLFGRFEVLATLGHGAFGRVVRARDRETQVEVAVKELYRFSAEALLQFKQEFRALSDVQHPNLVRLGELFESQGRWGFSMELLPGANFLCWVREPQRAVGFDEGRLRSGIAQLAQGLLGLHSLGLMHRDVKPANVLVTPAGRVVLLDFGLVTYLSRDKRASDGEGAGTAEYMAPEQADAAPIGPAADWYALGVLMYEALTGQLPFQGSAIEILLEKQRREADPPREKHSGIPAYLDRLCSALLARDPAQRPTGEEVLAAVGRSVSSLPPSSAAAEATAEVFIGRVRELAELAGRFNQSRAGQLELAMIEGESGVGKTALVRRFVTSLQGAYEDVVVLEGRCHPAEQVPFKMYDGVVDDLARYLSKLKPATCRALLSPQAYLLPQLFPVLGNVEAIRETSERRRASTGMPVERYVLFSAFANLLSRVSETSPLLLVIDDLQWGDEESVQLTRALLEATPPVRAVIIGTVRHLESIDGTLGRELRVLATHPQVARLPLIELGLTEARALTAHWLGVDPHDPQVNVLAAEAAGHPLFIAELANQANAGVHGTVHDLDDALRLRAARLGPLPRKLLDLLAVAGAPTPLRIAGKALGMQGEELERAASNLRNGRFARVVRRGELTCYHDRVREALLGGLDDASRLMLHGRLALAWSESGYSDAARVASHWLAADKPERALPWLEEAAERALHAAAFERAADLYHTVLEVGATLLTGEHAHRLRLARAEALASAGRSAESARGLLESLEAATGEERRDLHVRAAQQLLQAGQIEEGLAAAKLAMKEVGLAWPSRSSAALLRLLWHRVTLRARGLVAPMRESGDVPARVHLQLDTLWRLWQPLIWADLLRNAEVGARHLRLALNQGPPLHVGLALLAEAMMVAIQDASAEKAGRLIEQALPFVDKEGSARLEAYRSQARGTVAFLAWDLRTAARELELAEVRYREECPGEAWMLANVRSTLLAAAFSLGDHRAQAEATTRWIREAESRGDKFAMATYSVLGLGFVRHLMRDDPEGAHAEVTQAMEPWQTGDFGLQHLGETIARQGIDFYRGGLHAAEYWDVKWPQIRSSFLVKTRFASEMLPLWRADAMLRAALAEPEPVQSRRFRQAQQLIKSLAGARSGFCLAWVPLIQAQMALIAGDHVTAKSRAARAQEAFQHAGHFVERHCNLVLAFLDSHEAFHMEEHRLRLWHREQGWSQPQRAIGMWLPTYAWLLNESSKSI